MSPGRATAAPVADSAMVSDAGAGRFLLSGTMTMKTARS